jgi:hypothetical protein
MTAPRTDAPVMLRRYAAATYEGALDIYEADLPGMADAGWLPVGQVWGWDPVGSAGWLVSGSHWKPGHGTLAVTYRRGPRATASIEP